MRVGCHSSSAACIAANLEGCGACAAADPAAYPIVGLEYFLMDQDSSTLGAPLLSAPLIAPAFVDVSLHRSNMLA